MRVAPVTISVAFALSTVPFSLPKSICVLPSHIRTEDEAAYYVRDGGRTVIAVSTRSGGQSRWRPQA